MSPIIALRDVEKVYDMGQEQIRALDGVTLSIDKGEYLAVMGPSGSGKSTLMNIIGCLDSPTAGTYALNQQEVAGLKDDELAAIRNREIGFIFQTFNLLPRADALQNVELPLIYSDLSRAERRELAEKALHSVGLGDRIRHRPNELSGGQRQRVAMARALVNRPSILLADEPTGNLDSRTGDEIMDVIGSLHDSGHTIVLVTHEELLASRAARLVRLRDGKIASDESS